MAQYISNVITSQELDKIQAGQFNVIKAPPGCGKTTFMFDERILNFARDRKHVLYLIHNKLTRDFIAQNHADKAIVFNDNNCNGWFQHRNGGLWTAESDENMVHVMCYQTFAALLRNEGTDWLNDIDLIIWDEFDDFKPYYEKEVSTIKKILPNFSREKLIALLQEGRTTSVVNFIYQMKTSILEPAKIKLIAISATPELAAVYFGRYVNYILNGKLENVNDALGTIFIDNVADSFKNGEIHVKPGYKIWCYTKYVHEALHLESVMRALGIRVISIWSENNINYRNEYTEEKARVTQVIRDTGMVPDEYDVIVTTGVLGRGVDVYDESIQDWICNSSEYEDIVQSSRARFAPERRYLLEAARGIVEFVQNGFASNYYEWHTLAEIKELLDTYPIFTNTEMPERLTNFQAVKKYYPDLFEKRQHGKARVTEYRIRPAE